MTKQLEKAILKALEKYTDVEVRFDYLRDDVTLIFPKYDSKYFDEVEWYIYKQVKDLLKDGVLPTYIKYKENK